MLKTDTQIPLCVDLDGTLVRSDMLHETVMLLIKKSPLSMVALPIWLKGGKANLKRMIAERVELSVGSLPYRKEVLDLIATARCDGRHIVLATAAPSLIANAIADHLGIFDEVLSSSSSVNLAGARKAELLSARFGEGGFDYIGNDHVDIEVIKRARRGYLVTSSKSIRKTACESCKNISFIDNHRGGLKSWIKAIRVHQWLKNGLIFIPALAAHEVGNFNTMLSALIAFVSFCLCASSVYILNDILDLSSDRIHKTKHRRPFASGELPILSGVLVMLLLLALSVMLALTLNYKFLLIIGFYYLITLSYSIYLKKQVVVDVILLAGLYTTRILAGAAATEIMPSFWLLAFSMFVFLCLAMVKRYSELRVSVKSQSMLAGRGYMPDDLPVIMSLGSSSGMVSVLILAMYMQSEGMTSMYPSPQWLWLTPPLMLYWITRLWLKAHRGEIDDDPVVFAARDWQSLVILGIMIATFLLAISNVVFW